MTTAITVPAEVERDLWPHQREAVKTVVRYVRAFQAGTTGGACLIHLPTGTGKTGVIATLARCVPGIGGVLILTPRSALRGQLARELAGGFWKKLRHGAPKLHKAVHVLLDEDPAALRRTRLEDLVLVGTVQKLLSIAGQGDPLYRRLQRELGLLMFDEGHYEPALEWRKAVRGLERPRVIFSATPFRNDFKLFDVDLAHSYSYSFHQAQRDGYVRAVQFEAAETPASPAAFVRTVVATYDRLYHEAGDPGTEPRAIIRCDDKEGIRKIGAALAACTPPQTFVAVHEAFASRPRRHPVASGADQTEYRWVPNPEQVVARFWVHQFKLLEGVDDPRFQLLAVFDRFSSVRQLVQQIGRVVRNPGRRRGAVAHVIDCFEGALREMWENYLEYDLLVQNGGLGALDLSGSLLKAVERAHPSIVYVDGKFRSPISLEKLALGDLLLPRSANVLQKKSGFSASDVAKALFKRYRDKYDRPTVVLDESPERCVLAYIQVDNSPLLESGVFLEATLGVTVVAEAGAFVCFYDSAGSHPADLPGIGDPVGPGQLQRLFSSQLRSRLYTVSLHNSNPAPTAVRAKTLTAAPIEATVPSFEDHAFILRRAVGAVADPDRSPAERDVFSERYVGFGNGRISDGTSQRVSFREYEQWLGGIVSVLTSSRYRPIRTLQRYAAVAPVPDDPTPQSILIDVADLRERFKTSGALGVAADADLDIPRPCVPVREGVFTLRANGVRCPVQVTFEPARHRYRLESERLDLLYTPKDPRSRERPVVDFLNWEQAFQVIPAAREAVYAGGAFYCPRITFGPKYNDSRTGLLAMLRGYAVFDQVKSEKGERGTQRGGKGWEAGSLFDLVDSLGAPAWERGEGRSRHRFAAHFTDPRLLVCDDMGTEFADFILARETTEGRKYVAFIHAKAQRGDGSRLSAANLTDVCGQAQKNLRELRLFEDPTATREERWSRPWQGGKLGEVRSRLRLGAGTGAEAWEKLRAWVEDPSVEREVWLIVSRTLSKQALEEGLRSDSVPTEAVHVAHLLLLTREAVRSAGARLQVFCGI